jgi:plasmid replication initiation protein
MWYVVTTARRLSQLAKTLVIKNKKKKPTYDITKDELSVRGFDPNSPYITVSNALNRAGSNLTLSEKRIVFLAIGKLDSKRPVPKKGEEFATKITAKEYADTFDVDMNTAYDQLKAASKVLYERSINFLKADKKNMPNIKARMRWVGSVEYFDQEGWVELDWYHRVVPHLVAQKKDFTTYRLQQATALRSIYSWRLFELLNQYKSTGWAQFTVEDFLVSMDAPPSMLNGFGQIKRRIINPAIKELKEKDGFIVNVEEIRAGRKVGSLRFTFGRDPQTSFDFK